jgi:hypothetical protein
MPLRDLDREYRGIINGTNEERMEYCENLIKKMQDRLAADFTGTSRMRSLILEMIESAEKEIELLRTERRSKT